MTPTAYRLEHFDSAGAIRAEPVEIVDGRVIANCPGLGLTWDERAVARWAV